MGPDGEQRRLSKGYKQSSGGAPRLGEAALTLDSPG